MCCFLLTEQQKKITSRVASAFHTLYSCPPRPTSSPTANHALPAVLTSRVQVSVTATEQGHRPEDAVVWAYAGPHWCATRPRRPAGRSSAPHLRTSKGEWRLDARPARRRLRPWRCRRGVRPGGRTRASQGVSYGCLPPRPRPPTQLPPPLAAVCATAAGATAADDTDPIATAAFASPLHRIRHRGAAAAADGRGGGAVAQEEGGRDGCGRSGHSRRGSRWPFPPL